MRKQIGKEVLSDVELKNFGLFRVDFNAFNHKIFVFMGWKIRNCIDSSKTAITVAHSVMKGAFAILEKDMYFLSEGSYFNSEDFYILEGLDILKNYLLEKLWLIIETDTNLGILELG